MPAALRVPRIVPLRLVARPEPPEPLPRMALPPRTPEDCEMPEVRAAVARSSRLPGTPLTPGWYPGPCRRCRRDKPVQGRGGLCGGCCTKEQWRRRPRKPGQRKPGEGNPPVACACGCGERLPKYDAEGRPRKYVHGHNGGNRCHKARKGV
jgi:hypothetical protein